jgi:tRNA-dihydrouridine synthase
MTQYCMVRSWVDINCGCPTFEASRRGLGAVLLRNPSKLERLVREITGAGEFGSLAVSCM